MLLGDRDEKGLMIRRGGSPSSSISSEDTGIGKHSKKELQSFFYQPLMPFLCKQELLGLWDWASHNRVALMFVSNWLRVIYGGTAAEKTFLRRPIYACRPMKMRLHSQNRLWSPGHFCFLVDLEWGNWVRCTFHTSALRRSWRDSGLGIGLLCRDTPRALRIPKNGPSVHRVRVSHENEPFLEENSHLGFSFLALKAWPQLNHFGFKRMFWVLKESGWQFQVEG